MRAKIVNEAIKHLGGRSEEEIRDFKQSLLDEVYKVYEIVSKYSIAFRVIIKPFFYKNKASMLFENRKNSKYQYSYEFSDAGFGTFMILKPNDIQRFHARELDYLEEIIKREAKLNVSESIKHLTPKSREEIKKGIMELPVKERLPAAVHHNIEFTPEEMAEYQKDLHDWVMSQPFHLAKKAAIQWNVELTPEDLEIIETNQVNKYKKMTEADKVKVLMNSVKWNDEERVEYLLKAGANIDAHEGRPIRIAVENESISMVKLLLKYGADITFKNNLAIKFVKKRIKDIETDKWFTVNKERDIARCMQILKILRDHENKHVNEGIKHLGPKKIDIDKLIETNWERAKGVFYQTLTSGMDAKYATQDDKDNFKIVIDTLSELGFVVETHYSQLGFYSLRLEDFKKNYSVKFWPAFFVPKNYDKSITGLDIKAQSTTKQHLGGTMDMEKAKAFINQFRK